MEYTLEDAFQILKKKKAELEKNIDVLTTRISNNPAFAIESTSFGNDLKLKQIKLQQNLLTEIQDIQPENYATPRTSDLHSQVMMELEKEINDMQQLLSNLEKKLFDIQKDITYLKNKQTGFDKMQEAYLNAIKISANRTYKEEHVLTRRIFQEVKSDLYTIVDIMFPNNNGFKELLSALTAAYMQGGDEVYIDIQPADAPYINFLLEADIIQYHRNDKTKIRMIELL